MKISSTLHLREAEDHLSSVDPQMADLIQRYGPCQISPWEESLFPSLINTIISQQLSVKAAATISSRVRGLMPEGQDFLPQIIASLPTDALRKCGLSGAKTRYCQSLAMAVDSGNLDLEQLRQKEDVVIQETLIAHPGIGRWTVEMFLIFAIGSPDIISPGDLGLKKGLQMLLELEERPDDQLFLAHSEIWQPWRSVASWYLWKLVD